MVTSSEPAPRATRRRGEVLHQAIYQATLAELARTSVAELTFDKIAPLAGTGKSALYRRWSSPEELVLAALTDPSAGFGDRVAPNTGTLRGDLLALLGEFAQVLGEPRGQALRPLLSQRRQHPALYEQVQLLVVQPRQKMLLEMLRAAVERGEADPRCVTPRVASVGPRLVLAEALAKDTVSPSDVQSIVDEVLLPLTAVRP
ncbi:TetR/AcrR family transcriptional regulator [Kutzneria sp. CA-103260]|uniref:TetR/AcrR family transcriptional regulator n=1 Tax=Kutzneria sp. CA-103260 TaxID=2802641 RepID=UPI001BA762C5|nr:TetR/AcrR family transcriptional regulator [Kutzneria sp. CA-103260]QUQ62394.1 TetR family transcriptional regulator [Kutzneria sp. CA-103260]